MTDDTALRLGSGGALRGGPPDFPVPGSRRIRALAEPLVAGSGLAAVPEALELQRRGVSARTVVVVL